MKRGITVSTLAISVTIMLILISVSTVVGVGSIRTAAYEEFLSKLTRVSNDVNFYLRKNNELPITNEIVSKEGLPTTLRNLIANNGDNTNELYVIDMDLLNTETVNIGNGTTDNMDVFVVAQNTNNIYYLKGYKYKDEVCYGNGTSVEKAKWVLQKTLNEEGTKVVEAKVTNGTLTLDVGTTINYMPEGVGPADAKYTGGWKILGVDDEGRLLIMSSQAVISNLPLASEFGLNQSIKGYEDALTTLQTAVNDYKDGIIGIEVRSVKVEDIDGLTTFDKTTFNKGEINEYGNKVTFSWAGDEYPTYSYGIITGKLEKEHSTSFIYYDVEAKKVVKSSYTKDSGIITILESNAYAYAISSYLDTSIPAFSLLEFDGEYWLASRYINTTTSYVDFGLFVVDNTRLCTEGLSFTSNNSFGPAGRPIRAVVTLADDVKLTENQTAVGTYDVTVD